MGSLTTALLICLAPTAVDGDTIRCGNSDARIRVWGVNAVEKGQPGYLEATAALTKHIQGGLMCEPRGASYSRIVALCYDASGRDVGLELLKVEQTVVEWCSYSRNYYGTCAVSHRP